MNKMSSVVVAAFVAISFVVGAGCAPAHVRLGQLPSDGASLAERQAFYEASRPVVGRKADVTIGGARLRSFVILNDGTRVDHADDLFAHVASDSPAGLAAARAVEAEERAGLLGVAGGITTGVGIAMMVPETGLRLVQGGSASAPSSDVALAVTISGLAGSLATLAGAGMLIFAQGNAVIAAQERDAAFALYGASLRQRLGLSAEDVDNRPIATQDRSGVVVVNVLPR